jgi:hypothetical protein
MSATIIPHDIEKIILNNLLDLYISEETHQALLAEIRGEIDKVPIISILETGEKLHCLNCYAYKDDRYLGDGKNCSNHFGYDGDVMKMSFLDHQYYSELVGWEDINFTDFRIGLRNRLGD